MQTILLLAFILGIPLATLAYISFALYINFSKKERVRENAYTLRQCALMSVIAILGLSFMCGVGFSINGDESSLPSWIKTARR